MASWTWSHKCIYWKYRISEWADCQVTTTAHSENCISVRVNQVIFSVFAVIWQIFWCSRILFMKFCKTNWKTCHITTNLYDFISANDDFTNFLKIYGNLNQSYIYDRWVLMWFHVQLAQKYLEQYLIGTCFVASRLLHGWSAIIDFASYQGSLKLCYVLSFSLIIY